MKWRVLVDGQGLPLGNHLHLASTAEVRLKSKSYLLGQRLHVIGKLNLAQLEKAQLTVDGWTLLNGP